MTAERWKFLPGDGNTHGTDPAGGARPCAVPSCCPGDGVSPHGSGIIGESGSAASCIRSGEPGARSMFPEDGFRNHGRERGSAGQSRRLPGTAPDPLDTRAGIGAPGAIAADLGLFGDHRAVRGCRRCMERGEPSHDVLSGDIGDRPAPAPGQGQIPAEPGIDRPCARLPVPPVTPEDFLGHCLERDIAGSGSGLFTPGMDPACVRARFCKAMSSASRMS